MYSKMGRMGETPAVLSLPNLFLSFPSPLRIVTSRCLENFGKLHAACACQRDLVQFLHLSFATGKQNFVSQTPGIIVFVKS